MSRIASNSAALPYFARGSSATLAIISPLRRTPSHLYSVPQSSAGLTQARLAEKLEVTQQAVAQAERWDSNPTVAFINRWANACAKRLEIRFSNM